MLVSFVEILEYFWHAKGPHSTYRFFQECLVAHNAFIKQLPVASVGAALAEINQDEESQYELLRLCIDLGSADAMHYASLCAFWCNAELNTQGNRRPGRALPEDGVFWEQQQSIAASTVSVSLPQRIHPTDLLVEEPSSWVNQRPIAVVLRHADRF